ncbi:hypothetical protein [Streptomyces sp. SID8352]|uniref:hypothetical protein n=1 Tax=Streptomyces sp. SID8352 TaxID=2690338 RepID=UPI00136BA31D|nr:hypothetical protein [Streptomyces sp. SID8352]MYU22859.1 hypothetical protein [Streptomyces sp. SID8352]
MSAQAASTPEQRGTTMLALPQLRLLSDAQRDGRACPWCATSVTEDTGVDLGIRPSPAGVPIHPRGCRPCVHRVAATTYTKHPNGCDQCERRRPCEARRTLQLLTEEGPQ